MSPKKQNVERVVALCYVRQSFTRNENDMSSPERQRANIEAYCERKGWVTEWYEDVDGHKSGREVENRPSWLKMKRRLGDPDVVAVVANDLARIHRKAWRVGQLADELETLGVALVLAEPGREIDTSNVIGRMALTLIALNDEAYANDISQRVKAGISYRQDKGITVGLPPFGTDRNEDGYLVPSVYGAWLLPSGDFLAGKVGDEKPVEDALWRGYFEAAEHLLKLYVTSNRGYEKLAYKMNEDGWVYRSRDKQPRPFKREDIRRILANWPEYGGIVLKQKAKDRPGYAQTDIDEIMFNESRAVYDTGLLREVARIRQARSRKPVDHGKKRQARFYPLSVVSRCAHCEAIAQEKDDPKLQSTLSGHTGHDGTIRYVHKRGIECGCTNRSIPADVLEEEFERLLNGLTFNQDALDLMVEMAIQSQDGVARNDQELAAKKKVGIARAQRRIDAAIHLYRDGVIDRAEYLRDVEANEREIAHWQARTSETQQAAIELEMVMNLLNQITTIWQTSNDEDKQQLVRMFFEEIIVDLDTQRITTFRLKAWADRFLILRAGLYEQEGVLDELEEANRPCLDVQDMNDEMPHRGLWNRGFHRPRCAMDYGLRLIYWGKRTPDSPVLDGSVQQVERNQLIRVAYADGVSVSELMQRHRISRSRVYQVLKGN